MSANDYIAILKKSNEELFEAETLKIKRYELLRQITLAFNEGKKAGKESQSVFERIFGR